MTRNEIISKIIELELEITSAIFRGHRCHVGDKFQESRELLQYYRKLIFKIP